jgi:hypothetical protein
VWEREYAITNMKKRFKKNLVYIALLFPPDFCSSSNIDPPYSATVGGTAKRGGTANTGDKKAK